MNNDQEFIIDEIVRFSHKLDEKGYVANHDGNITARLGSHFLATPGAVSKSAVTKANVVTVDAAGNKIAGGGKSFSEIKLHFAAYRARPEINAVMHAHPPFATARGLVNLPIRPSLPEAVVSLGDLIPVVAFAMPGVKENDEIISNALSKYDVLMMPGNGVLAIGNCVEQAFLRIELVEHLAKIDYYATHMGMPRLLTDEQIANLLEKRIAAGLGPKQSSGGASVITPSSFASRGNSELDDLKKIIMEELKKVL